MGALVGGLPSLDTAGQRALGHRMLCYQIAMLLFGLLYVLLVYWLPLVVHPGSGYVEALHCQDCGTTVALSAASSKQAPLQARKSHVYGNSSAGSE